MKEKNDNTDNINKNYNNIINDSSDIHDINDNVDFIDNNYTNIKDNNDNIDNNDNNYTNINNYNNDNGDNNNKTNIEENADDFFITRKKSNTYNANIIPPKEPLKTSNEFYSSLKASKNKEKKKNSYDYIKSISRDKIIDTGGEISSCIDKTKEIELLLSDPELLNSIDEENLNSYDSRGTLQKLMAKMGKGSLRRVILNLSIINICISSLNLSQKVVYVSIYVYPLFIIIIGIISCWTLHILTNISHKYKKRSYEGLIKEVLFKELIPFYILFLILNNFGNIILEEIILYKIISDVIIKFYANKKETFEKTSIKYFILYGVALFILFPIFQIQKNNEKFGQVIIFEIILLVVIFLIIMTNYILLFIYECNIHDVLKKYKLNLDYYSYPNNEFFNSVVVLFYSFSYHDQFFPSLEKLSIPTRKRIKKIIKRTIFIDIIINFILSVVGYFSLPVDLLKINDLLILRNDKEREYIINDYLMTIGRIFVFIYLLFKLYKDYQYLRNILLVNICCCNIKKIGKVVNILTSLLILFFSIFIAVNYQYISEFICLIGGSSSVYISFIIPLIMYINENDYSICNWRNILIFLLISFFFFSSSSSIFFTFKKISSSFKND